MACAIAVQELISEQNRKQTDILVEDEGDLHAIGMVLRRPGTEPGSPEGDLHAIGKVLSVEPRAAQADPKLIQRRCEPITGRSKSPL